MLTTHIYISSEQANTFMAELSPSYMHTRTILGQLKTHLYALYPLAPPSSSTLYLPAKPTFTNEERTLVGRWKAYLRFEESNPLNAQPKTLLQRVQDAYKKAVVRMRFYGEIWCVL
jgi:cleavage stimulation factor subunit 3